jgi:hypothetical protein
MARKFPEPSVMAWQSLQQERKSKTSKVVSMNGEQLLLVNGQAPALMMQEEHDLLLVKEQMER